MNRPTTAFLCAMVAAVALSAGVSYAVVPDHAAELSMKALPPQDRRDAEGTASEELHCVREYPEKQGRLVSPFLPEHPTREQSKPAPAVATFPKPGPARAGRGSPVPQENEIRFVGTVSAETGRRAILSVGKRQIALAVGEEKDGLTLVSLTEESATIATSSGERILTMGAGRVK